jgi:iron complex outermembrane receptor protein
MLEVRGAHSHAPKADNPGALTTAELAADPSQAAPNNLARHAGKEVDQQQASITLRRYGSAENRFAVTLFGLSRSLDNPLATNVFVTLDRRAGGVRFEATNRLTGSARLTWGLDLQRMRDDRTNSVLNQGRPTDTLLLDQRETVTELGPFAHLLWSLGERVLLSTGVRYDRVSFDVNDRFLGDSVDNSGNRTMSALSGHAGVSLTGSAEVTPYLNASTSFETPTTTELVNQPNGAGGFNGQLDPQRAVTLEAGIRGTPRPWLSYSAAAFMGRISDALIQFSEVGGRAFFTNAGRLHNDGVELWLRVSPTPEVGLSAAYTFAHYRFARYRIVNGTAVDTLDGNRLAGVPDHFLRLWLQVSPIPAIRFDVEQQLSSRVFADDANTLEAPGWGAGVTSLRGSAEVAVGAIVLEPFGGISNLFDKRYVSSVTVNGFGGRVFEPAPGRNGYFGLEIRYR